MASFGVKRKTLPKQMQGTQVADEVLRMKLEIKYRKESTGLKACQDKYKRNKDLR